MSLPASPDDVRRRLDERARQLEQEVAARRARAEPAEPEVADQKDQAGERSLEAVDGAEIERDLAELREIAAARERLASGRYGLCVDCGETIEAARLLAHPSAIRCLSCQGDRERRRAGTR
ncbi:MAG TPA: TraR/DksA C4-type zinc finger protein [Ideonella sp.]|nr:TraR/DksA C4-type zinc finger protein [Ideonella sp.]